MEEHVGLSSISAQVNDAQPPPLQEDWQQQLQENLKNYERDPDLYFPEFGEWIAMSPDTMHAVMASLEGDPPPSFFLNEQANPPLGPGPRDLTAEFMDVLVAVPGAQAIENDVALCKSTFADAYAKLQVARELVGKLPPMYRSASAHFIPNEQQPCAPPDVALKKTIDAIAAARAALNEVKEVILSAPLNPPLRYTR